MKPIKFPQANKTLLPPKGMDNCEELHVYSDEKYCISRWKPSFKERIQILFGDGLWLWVVSKNTQPPVSLTVSNPWES